MQKGFTLIELMIVVAIIGILSSFALPAYQEYLARAQVAESVNLTGAGKAPLSEYFADRGAWPSEASDVMGTVSGKYTSAITIVSGGNASTTLVVEARLREVGTNVQIAGRTLQIQTTNGNAWECGMAVGGTLSAKFRPVACR
jgi:type IV pilus assembly protein PilA